MKYGVYSCNEWVYPDSEADNGCYAIDIVQPRNSYACAQLLVEVETPISICWEANDGMPSPEIFRLLPVFIEKNTGVLGFTVEPGTPASYATRQAPFWVFDALEPMTGPLVRPDNASVLGVYLRWSTRELMAKTVTGRLIISTLNEQAVIPVTLTVANVRVPEQETFRLSNWFSIENMATYHQVPLWSEEHWKKIAAYGKQMRRMHQTDVIIQPSLAIPRQGEDGQWRFDFSRCERLIRLFLSLGFRFIEGGTPIFRRDWSDDHFVVNVGGELLSAMSEDSYLYLQAYFTAWYAFLKQHNWLDITLQHVADEPHEANAMEYRVLSGMVRKWMPGISLLEAVETPDLDGAVDVWIPKPNTYDEHKAKFTAKHKRGDRLWYYTCCCPGGKYINRLLDGSLLRCRYLPWACVRYGLEGYLHWGLNYYELTDDPFCGRAGCIETLSVTALPCGDSHVFYPQNGAVLSSVRAERIRAGLEDAEILAAVMKNDPDAAMAVMDTCFRSFTDYTEDAYYFDKMWQSFLLQV